MYWSDFLASLATNAAEEPGDSLTLEFGERGDQCRLVRDRVDPREVGLDRLFAELVGAGLIHEALVEIADLASLRSFAACRYSPRPLR